MSWSDKEMDVVEAIKAAEERRRMAEMVEAEKSIEKFIERFLRAAEKRPPPPPLRQPPPRLPTTPAPMPPKDPILPPSK